MLIVLQELLFNSDYLFRYTDQKVFLTAFRIKSCLSLILVPRLWLGDQSLVLKSSLFSLYQTLFWTSTLSFGLWTFFSQPPLDRGSSTYYTFKQKKFELLVLMLLNFLPSFLLLAPSFHQTLLLLLCLISVLSLSTSAQLKPLLPITFLLATSIFTTWARVNAYASEVVQDK